MSKCCFVIDPFEKLKPYKDSSVALMFEAQQRGMTVYAAEFGDFAVRNGAVEVMARKTLLTEALFEQKSIAPPYGEQHAPETVPLDDLDYVFIRKDPPFDSDYLSLTLLLSTHKGATTFVNAPRGLRDVSEKLVATRFAEFTPDTLVTYSADQARAFAANYDGVVLKPAYFGAGDGVKKSAASDSDFEAHFMETLHTEPRGPVIVQQFLPDVAQGDTRVMIIDGVVEGALGRMPAEGEFRANIAAGGKEVARDLTARQREVCAAIGPFLMEEGVRFAGVDFIGDYLIEINVTSPALILELKRVAGIDMAAIIWDRLQGQA